MSNQYSLGVAIDRVMQGTVTEIYLTNNLRVALNNYASYLGGYMVSASSTVKDRAVDLEWGTSTLEVVQAHIGDNVKWKVVLIVGGLLPSRNKKEPNPHEVWLDSRLKVREWQNSHKGSMVLATAITFGWGVFILPRH